MLVERTQPQWLLHCHRVDPSAAFAAAQTAAAGGGSAAGRPAACTAGSAAPAGAQSAPLAASNTNLTSCHSGQQQ